MKKILTAMAVLALALIGFTSPARAGIFDFDRVPGLIAGMVFVEGGCFVMGDRFSEGYPDERPTHEVCVDDFYIGKYEVTVGAFRAFVDKTGHITDAEKQGSCRNLTDKGWLPVPGLSWRNPGFLQKNTSPVTCISHNDASAYAKWMSGRQHKTYRLPTEAEWEFASRSRGRNYKYPWGNRETPVGNLYDSSAHKNIGPISALGNYHDGYIHTSPVASYAPNLLGIHDLSGNLWEWVHDYYDGNYYADSPRINPTGPESGRLRVIRGGSWYSKFECLRTSKRSKLPPGDSYTIVGFRLAVTPR